MTRTFFIFLFTIFNLNGAVRGIAGPTPPPLTVRSSNRMRCDQKAGVCTAEGHVVIQQGTMRLTAPRVQLTFSTDKGQNPEIKTLHAYGNAQTPVILNEGNLQAVGQRAFYEANTQKAWLYGRPRLQTPGITVTSLHPFMLNRRTRRGYVQQPHIVFPDEKTVIRGAAMSINLEAAKLSKETLLIDLQDNVLLASKTHSLNARKAHYDGPQGTLTFMEHVSIADDRQTLAAHCLTYNLKTQTAVAHPRSTDLPPGQRDVLKTVIATDASPASGSL